MNVRKLYALSLAAIFALCMVFAVGCTSSSSSSTSAASSASASASASAASASSAASSASASASASAASTRIVKDMKGNEVEIPATITTLGTSWPGFINTVCVAGGSQYITATPKALSSYPWAYKIFPNLSDAKVVFDSEASIELLAEQKPDVLFLRKQDDIDGIKKLGIPVLEVEYKNNSIYDMVSAVEMVGEVIGGEGVEQAAKYRKFVDDNVAAIAAVADKIADADKPTVLMLSIKKDSYSTWGKNIIQNEEIKIAGGINVAADEVDGSKEVTSEMVLKWDPEYIFLVGTQAQVESFKTDATFADLKAVQNGNVYVVPKGVFVWSNLGSETALYLVWMAQTLYPDQLASLNVEGQAKDFYKTFFNYDLSDDDLQRILTAQDPA